MENKKCLKPPTRQCFRQHMGIYFGIELIPITKPTYLWDISSYMAMKSIYDLWEWPPSVDL